MVGVGNFDGPHGTIESPQCGLGANSSQPFTVENPPFNNNATDIAAVLAASSSNPALLAGATIYAIGTIIQPEEITATTLGFEGVTHRQGVRASYLKTYRISSGTLGGNVTHYKQRYKKIGTTTPPGSTYSFHATYTPDGSKENIGSTTNPQVTLNNNSPSERKAVLGQINWYCCD